VLNACATISVLEEADVFMSESIKMIVSLMSFWGKVGWHVFLNVVAQRMLGECSTSHHLEMWSVGLLYLEDVPWMGEGKETF